MTGAYKRLSRCWDGPAQTVHAAMEQLPRMFKQGLPVADALIFMFAVGMGAAAEAAPDLDAASSAQYVPASATRLLNRGEGRLSGQDLAELINEEASKRDKMRNDAAMYARVAAGSEPVRSSRASPGQMGAQKSQRGCGQPADIGFRRMRQYGYCDRPQGTCKWSHADHHVYPNMA